MMQRDDGVPIDESKESAGLEKRCLPERAVGFINRGNLEFELGFAWQLHFGTKGEPAIALHPGDAPEIEGFAIADAFGITTAATEARAADETIEPTADLPEPVGGKPTVAAADAADGAEDGVGGSSDVH